MYDLAIIGAGAGGIAAAKKAVKSGLKTVLIDKSPDSVGGTCINYGCIPTKFFLQQAKNHKTWPEIFKEKENLISAIKEPLLNYLERQKVTIVFGQASFIDAHNLKVNNEKIQAKNIIIATGSKPKKIISGNNVIFAEDIFKLNDIPNKFLIVGGGYIGIEIASLLNALNKDVTVVEFQDSILPFLDRSLASRLTMILAKRGIKILTKTDANSQNLSEFDQVLVSVGREPNLEDLNCSVAGIIQEPKGWIKTNEFLASNVDNVYACGDVRGVNLLAYVAEYEGEICLDNILGKRHKRDYSPIPECVFSLPQVARVGKTQEELQANNIAYKTIQANFLGFSSAYVYNDKEGSIKLLLDNNGYILGASIISNYAAELINYMSFFIRNHIRVDQIKDTMFIHPTMSEIVSLMLAQG